ncbi:spore protease YyaC [Desulfallas sp. Bu1-1]|jgi:putative sporulation protein YyaC|uniref:spore protease YyaC n=1 Tax=Desulfallas sp. Bu1-1 TaxID=2787620 RepID=UPI00189E8A21|nr:spore protease YyaC [Desulfallas sp. Bu1-1]MBF7084030.1 spore protease YyaC [Desulfallas sp. Bu1-1]
MDKEFTNEVHFADRYGLIKAVSCLERILPGPEVETTYLCIGSDLSTGDCFGPLTGTLLKRTGFQNVVGTLDATVHAKNLEACLQQLPKEHFIVAIDATMGHYKKVGTLSFIDGPVRPGAAFDRKLPPVGDASVVFNVAPYGIANFWVLGCASLNKVWQASNLLARAINIVAYRRNKLRAPKCSSINPCGRPLPGTGKLI